MPPRGTRSSQPPATPPRWSSSSTAGRVPSSGRPPRADGEKGGSHSKGFARSCYGSSDAQNERTRSVRRANLHGRPPGVSQPSREATMLKKALLAILAAMVLPQAARAAGGPIKIGMTVPGLKFPFFVTMKNDAEKAAAKLGATIVFADAQNDSSKQAADVENFVAQGVQAILISHMTVDSHVH